MIDIIFGTWQKIAWEQNVLDLMQYDFLCSSGRVVFLSQGDDAEQQTQPNELRSVGYY